MASPQCSSAFFVRADGLRRPPENIVIEVGVVIPVSSSGRIGSEKDFAMNSRRTFVAAFACVLMIAVVGSRFSAFSRVSAPVRIFEFTYLTRIPGLPPDAKTSRIWIPLPQSEAYQTISDLTIESPFHYATHHDSEYGNAYAYLEVPAAKVAVPAEVRVTFHVTRQQHRVALGAHSMAANTGTGAGDLRRF